MASNKTVLVAGSHGVIGRAAAAHFVKAGATVYGLSRRPGDAEPSDLAGVRHVCVDLLDPADVDAKLRDLHEVTHVVFGAYVERPTAAEKSVVNVAILENLLDVVERTAPAFEHITFYQGGKAYGADLGPFKTPAREDDPRLMPPNFYYDQEDLLRRRQAGKRWHFTALRPEAVCGFAVGNPMNLAMVVAVYAVISKALGLPLRFPGPEGTYRALYQVTSAKILARATEWAGDSEAARNEIFNITNGDYFRWEHLWPRIAAMFELDVAPPIPLRLGEYMADKEQLWNEIVQQHGLLRVPYRTLVSWAFGDFIFHSAFDNVSSTIKARRAGFAACIDTEDMFAEFFAELRAARIIPPLVAS